MKKLTLLGMAFALMLSVSPVMAEESDKTAVTKDGQFETLSFMPVTESAVTPMTDKELNAVEGKGLFLLGKFNIALIKQKAACYGCYKVYQSNSVFGVQIIK